MTRREGLGPAGPHPGRFANRHYNDAGGWSDAGVWCIDGDERAYFRPWIPGP